MELRKAQQYDIDELLLIREAFILEEHHGIDDHKRKVIKEGTFNYLKNHLNKDCFVFIAVENSKIISTVFMIIFEKPAGPQFLTGKIANIVNVYTLPEYRRQGTAEKLMHMVIEEARVNNVSFIDLKASQMGEGLYRKIGFEEDVCEYERMKLVLK